MFKINEHIMYGNVGVCQVVDITNEKFANNMQRECYVLDPIYSKNTVIKIPVDNERIAMRKILSKEEITLLISDINNGEVLFIEDDKKRNEQFKSMLKTGKCEELLTIIRSLYLDRKNKQAIGKKLSKGDDEIIQIAEKLLREEFSIILEISQQEVTDYIKEQIV